MGTLTTPITDEVLYREVQPYRELPPVVLLTVASALGGWALLIWSVVMGRPLGALVLPTWLAITLGVGLGIIFPVLFLWARMTTQVYADRVFVNTGLSGSHTFNYDAVAAVELRDKDVGADYNNRTVGVEQNTRVAYAINGLRGAQLTLNDGRFILIGSKSPEELTHAIDTAWQAITITS